MHSTGYTYEYICICKYVYVCNNNSEEIGHEFGENRARMGRGIWEGKEREKCNYYNLKNKQTKITTTLETNYTQP